MAELCLMASHGYSPDLVFPTDQGICRVAKDSGQFLPTHGSRQDIVKAGTCCLSMHEREGPWKPINRLLEVDQFTTIDSNSRGPVLFDMPADTCPDSFSFGIAEHCTRHEKILRCLMSGSNEAKTGELDLSILSDLMNHHALKIDVPTQPPPSDFIASVHDAQFQPSLVYPYSISYSQKSLLDIAGDMGHRSEITVQSDGRLSFTGARVEMKDMLSIISEFYLSKNSTKGTQSILVPYFDWTNGRRARFNKHGSSSNLGTVTTAPVTSTKKTKLKSSPRKKSNGKTCKERELYKNNYFHACESLLSIMVDKKRHGKSAILSLKKSGPEVPQLLAHFSASIAGTGLAVIFSVIYKLSSCTGPVCASRLLNTGLGLGLVWLSWAVNRLRETVVCINRSSGKLPTPEDEVMKTLDKRVNDIYFRTATLMVVALLRIA